MPYHVTFDSHTLESFCQQSKSKLTNKPHDDRTLKDDNMQPTEQITGIFFKLMYRSNFKYQVTFYCHFGKKTYDKDCMKQKIMTQG